MLKHRKNIAIILSIIMIFTNINIGIIAQENNKEIGETTLVEQAKLMEGPEGISLRTAGVGSIDIPFEISTATQLEELSRLVDKDESYWNNTKKFAEANYILTKDIDLSNYSSGEGWMPIGGEINPFKGFFDGGGHIIFNLMINRPGTSYQGLFGKMDDSNESRATIEKLGIIDCNINGKSYVGGIAGLGNIIKNCYVIGEIKSGNADAGGKGYAGGIAGVAQTKIANCYTVVNIVGKNGLAGIVSGDLNIAENCVALGASIIGESDIQYASMNGGTANIYAWDGMQAIGATDSETTKIGAEALRVVNPPCWDNWDKGIWSIETGYIPVFVNSVYKGDMPAHLSVEAIVGNGTESSPYQIETVEQLAFIRNKINTSISPYADLNKVFKLVADIDLSSYSSGEGWIPIGGKDNPFKGIFDGDGHIISNLTISRVAENYQGLFGNSVGIIKNVGIENASIEGKEFIGGIVGHTIATVTNCYVKGSIKGLTNAGGIVGYSGNAVNDCYVVGKVEGSIIADPNEIGGIGGAGGIGGIVGMGNTITNCYSETVLIAVAASVGGIAGKIGWDSKGSMTNCVAVGESVRGASLKGGVLGEIINASEINNCYANNNMKLNDVAITDQSEAIDNINGAAIDLLTVKGQVNWWRNLNYTKQFWLIKNNEYPYLRAFDRDNTIPDLKLEGMGTSGEPYKIKDIDDLVFMREQVNKGMANSGYSNIYFQMTGDIDISQYSKGEGWTPIGIDGYSFNGNFDGGGFNIIGLNINRPEATKQGFFGNMPTGKIQNLGIINANVIGKDHIGIIAGFAANIEGCYSTGYVQAEHILGGIAGYINEVGTVQNCYSTATVKGTKTTSAETIGGVGGIVGHSKGDVSKCYYTGEVTGYEKLGGIVGYIIKTKQVANCIMLGNRIVIHGENSTNSVKRILGAREANGTGTGVIDSYSWGKTKIGNELIVSEDKDCLQGKDISSNDIYLEENWKTWLNENSGLTSWQYTMDKLPKLKLQKDIAMDTPMYLIKDEAFSIKVGPQLFTNTSDSFTFPNMEVNTFPDKTVKNIIVQLTSGYINNDSIEITAEDGFSVTKNGPYMVKVNVDNKTAKEIQNFLRNKLTIKVAEKAASHERTIKFTMSDKDILNENVFYNEVNGHYYEYVFGMQKTWKEAYNEAKSKTYLGEEGYLATISNQSENDFISKFMKAHGWLGASSDSEILKQVISEKFNNGNGNAYDNSYADTTKSQGKFYWVNGDEKGQKFWQQTANRPEYVWDQVEGSAVAYRYENWRRSSGKLLEPNDYANKGERYLYMNKDSGDWSDYAADAIVYGYIVEYDGKNHVFADSKVYNCLTKVNPAEPKINDLDEEIAYSDISVLPEIVDSGYVLPKIGGNGSILTWSGSNTDLINNGDNIITITDLKCSAKYNEKTYMSKDNYYSLQVRPVAKAESPIIIEKADANHYLTDIHAIIEGDTTKYGVYPDFDKDLYTYSILIPKGKEFINIKSIETTKNGEGIVEITDDNTKKIVKHTINGKTSIYTINIVKAYIPIMYDYKYTGNSIIFSNAQYGTSPYEYSIDDGLSWAKGNPSFTGLNQGIYSIKIKDASGNITEPINIYIDGSTSKTGKGGYEEKVKSITLDSSTINMKIGEYKRLTPKIKPLNATNSELAWSSSDTGIATVDSYGYVTMIGSGSATITAKSVSSPDINAICAVSVAVPVTGVNIEPATLDLIKDTTFTLRAKVLPENAANKKVKWTSQDVNIATVSDIGLVTGIAVGTTTITATTEDGNKIANCPIEVKLGTIAVSGISLTENAMTIEVGKKGALKATVLPENATNKKVNWTSENEAIATVSDIGLVTGIAVGKTIITAKTQDGDRTATCAIEVKAEEILVNSISLSKNTMIVIPGEKEILKATVLPENATNKKVNWTSENEAIATVSDIGLVTGIAVGKTIITAKTQDGDRTATCAIEVKAEEKYNIIEGEIRNSDNVPMNGIGIKLMYKNSEKAETITKEGKFIFNEKLVDGIYHLIITNNGNTITESVVVHQGNTEKQFIVLGKGNKNTKVENTGKAPQVSINNISNIFNDKKCFTESDEELIKNGGTIEFKILIDENNIEKDKAKVLSKSEEIKATIGYYADIQIVKKIDNLPNEEIKETEQDILLMMEIPENIKGKDEYKVIRVHNQKVDVLEDMDTNNNTVMVKSNLFSTYALVYMNGSTNEDGNGGGGGGGGGGVAPAAPPSAVVPPLITPPITTLGKDDLPYYMRNGKRVVIGFSDMIEENMIYIAPEGVEILYMKNHQNYKDIGTSWAKEYIDFVTQREISRGTTADYFSPNMKMTRAMFITLIGRLYENSYGEIENISQSTYKDIAPNMYYAKYVEWATKNNITKGLTAEYFGVDEEVTREQMATTMYRLAKHMNKAPIGNWAIRLDYEDVTSMPTWAMEGAMYCKLKGVMTGKGGNNFRGQDTANRAEVATVITRFVKSILAE